MVVGFIVASGSSGTLGCWHKLEDDTKRAFG